MDVSLFIFVIVAAFFAYRGFKSGLLRSLSRIAIILGGYAAAIFFTQPVGEVISNQYSLQGILPLAIASVIVFFIAALAISLFLWLVKKLLPETASTSLVSSLGGATVGLGIGVLVAFVIIWTFAFVRDLQQPVPQTATTNSSTIENMANGFVGEAVGSAMSLGNSQSEVTRLTAALISSPAEMTQRVQRLSKSKELATLLRDPRHQAVLNSGNAKAIQNLPAFRQLVNNSDMKTLIRSSGLIDESSGNPPEVEAALAHKISDIWVRVQHVKNNNRFQEIVNDPEFQQSIQSANPVSLLSNSRLLELADIVFSDHISATDKRKNSSATTPKKESKIYSWTDRNGRIHFSDSEHKR